MFGNKALGECQRRKQLVLECDWLEERGGSFVRHFADGGAKDDDPQRFVELKDLHFDESFKPYAYDAEKDFLLF